MTSIYTQHEAAFANVSAYVVMKGADRVATIAFKFPRDGAGRLWAYVHWIGTEMTRGHASGYGYDKRTAACANAMSKGVALKGEAPGADLLTFYTALARDGGTTWDSALREAGFTVLQAV